MPPCAAPGVAADRMHFRNDRDVGAALGGFHRGAHPGEAAADDDDVVLDHYFEPPHVRVKPSCVQSTTA